MPPRDVLADEFLRYLDVERNASPRTLKAYAQALAAFDSQHTIGEGTHQRFAITVATFADKMKRKLEKSL